VDQPWLKRIFKVLSPDHFHYEAHMTDHSSYQEARATSKDGLSLYYRDYNTAGDDGRVPALCLPGMTRNSKDFEILAPHLARTRRVICADLRGRGRSDPDPDIANYNAKTYVNDVWQVLDAAGIPEVVVVGTSLGGIMAMLMSTVKPARVRGVILNDIGPLLEREGLDRISEYVSDPAPVSSWNDAAEATRKSNEAFYPDYGADHWMTFARRIFVEDDNGTVRPDYDPGIAQAMRNSAGGPTEMWPIFEGLKPIPALVLRGELSDLLSEGGVDRMVEEKPDLQRVTIAKRGHVPALDETESLGAIDLFFKAF
jgi:pimeloyl-ACP methyl ester carboxylesterase